MGETIRGIYIEKSNLAQDAPVEECEKLESGIVYRFQRRTDVSLFEQVCRFFSDIFEGVTKARGTLCDASRNLPEKIHIKGHDIGIISQSPGGATGVLTQVYKRAPARNQEIFIEFEFKSDANKGVGTANPIPAAAPPRPQPPKAGHPPDQAPPRAPATLPGASSAAAPVPLPPGSMDKAVPLAAADVKPDPQIPPAPALPKKQQPPDGSATRNSAALAPAQETSGSTRANEALPEPPPPFEISLIPKARTTQTAAPTPPKDAPPPAPPLPAKPLIGEKPLAPPPTTKSMNGDIPPAPPLPEKSMKDGIPPAPPLPGEGIAGPTPTALPLPSNKAADKAPPAPPMPEKALFENSTAKAATTASEPIRDEALQDAIKRLKKKTHEPASGEKAPPVEPDDLAAILRKKLVSMQSALDDPNPADENKTKNEWDG